MTTCYNHYPQKKEKEKNLNFSQIFLDNPFRTTSVGGIARCEHEGNCKEREVVVD